MKNGNILTAQIAIDICISKGWKKSKKRIKEEYSIIWLLTSISFVVFSFWKDGLEVIAKLLGIDYAPAALFIILFVALFLIIIQFSIIISKQSEQNKTLAQDIGLLKHELEEIKSKLKAKDQAE